MNPMRYFGNFGNLMDIHAFAASGNFLDQVPTPTGELCQWCGEKIDLGDVGFILDHIKADGEIGSAALHRECLMRTIVGSLGHIRKECACYGGDKEDPVGMTKRDAAKAAFLEFQEFLPIDYRLSRNCEK